MHKWHRANFGKKTGAISSIGTVVRDPKTLKYHSYYLECGDYLYYIGEIKTLQLAKDLVVQYAKKVR